MHIQKIGMIHSGQDGAIWDGYLFRFDSDGTARVYKLDQIPESGGELPLFSTFRLDQADSIVPHSNAVCFGPNCYEPGDEFPLLYSNIYNNHAKKEDPLTGVCCVYRLQRQGSVFSSTLVQLIEIGFVSDPALWRSSESQPDVRPYGNFTVDRDRNMLYAFVMRDACAATRYFGFPLPAPQAGMIDARWNVPKVTLRPSDISVQFDCPYHHFLQGACTHAGKIYSLEGFTDNVENPPALRVIRLQDGVQERHVKLADFGLTIEPEWIDFSGDSCFYSDYEGHLYMLSFKAEAFDA